MSRHTIAVYLIAVACLVGGCGAHRHAQPQPSAERAEAIVGAASGGAPPAGTAVTAAAVAAAVALFGANTVTDAGFDATWSRHPELLTPGFTDQLAQAQHGVESASWRTWRAHRAALAVSARVVLDDAPPDSLTVAARRLEVSVIPRGANGWVGARSRFGVVLTLLRLGNRGWLVAGIHVDD